MASEIDRVQAALILAEECHNRFSGALVGNTLYAALDALGAEVNCLRIAVHEMWARGGADGKE